MRERAAATFPAAARSSPPPSTQWSIDCAGRVWVDAGCSTGGFTDCLLQHGAALVHAVDVGENQLDVRMRSDARVRVRERAQHHGAWAPATSIPAPSAPLPTSPSDPCAEPRPTSSASPAGAWGIFLVKPQFEYQ